MLVTESGSHAPVDSMPYEDEGSSSKDRHRRKCGNGCRSTSSTRGLLGLVPRKPITHLFERGEPVSHLLRFGRIPCADVLLQGIEPAVLGLHQIRPLLFGTRTEGS